ncbi:MAG: hypothetical protein HQK54_16055, partial [Oligoflexales bacterium]|nr:hypothetical protein [Oligoflexales bacterium]
LLAISAAWTAIAVEERLVSPRSPVLSEAFRNVFVYGMGGSRSLSPDEKRAAFLSGTADTSMVGVTLYPHTGSNLGLTLRYYEEQAKTSNLVKTTLKSSFATVGTEYRLAPFAVRNRYIDSIHFSGSLNLGYGKIEENLSDSYNSVGEKERLFVGIADMKTFVPFIFNFWFVFDLGAVYQPYELKTLHVRSKSVNTQSFAGVCYALPI